MSAVVRGVPGAQIFRNHRTESGFARPPVGDKGRGRASGSVTCIAPCRVSRPQCAADRIKRKATAMAIATATETSFADEVETEPDLEPDPELHLRGRSCRCPAASVKADRDEGEWVCST